MKIKLTIPRYFLLLFFGIFAAGGISFAAEKTNPAQTQLSDKSAKNSALAFGGERHDFKLKGGNRAFVILPKSETAVAKKTRPWIWYAPTFVQGLPGRELEWLFPRLLEAGFGIAGVDVGESYGSPAGRKIYSQLHRVVEKKYSFASKACLLPQSRGGLMLYNWAVEHPDQVQCIGGIYSVCDLTSYPGVEKAAPAYAMTPQELTAHLAENNPVDRVAALVKAKVPIFHIHGDADKVVPLEKNAGELVQRYRTLGGSAQLVIIPGKGHEVCPEFFQSQALLDFFLSHGGKNAGSK